MSLFEKKKTFTSMSSKVRRENIYDLLEVRRPDRKANNI